MSEGLFWFWFWFWAEGGREPSRPRPHLRSLRSGDVYELQDVTDMEPVEPLCIAMTTLQRFNRPDLEFTSDGSE